MSVPTKVFIIPYRDRECHKIHFEIYMKYILQDIPKDEYEMYFVHQTDKQPFNRGGMKNIGFLAIKDKYPDDYKNITFIFNDVDTTPAKKNLLNFNTVPGIIKHFYGFTYALGGIFSITGSDFEEICGFPNFWGWGLEDNTIYNRAIENNIIVNRKQFYNLHDHNIIQLFDNNSRNLSKQEAWRCKLNNADDLTDIKNLVYSFKDEFINVKQFNTKFDPKSDDFYTKNNDSLSKLQIDKNFKPGYPKGFGNMFMVRGNPLQTPLV